ncbi:MAG TPA: type IV pilus assembly protein PilM [Candidatus Paceibacterota bacterium]|jgi:type IV pilus assembly protein PilM|nr:type IV pilus assembly protein PilM [Candidatus Paceibacterota bacterium]
MAGLFNIFSSHPSSYLGVDIGTTSIKVVEVRKGGKRPQVTNYGLLESSGYLSRANQALQTSSLKIFEADIVGLLKTVVREMGTGTKSTIASLPPFAVFTTVIDFPQMDAKEVEKAMLYQAKQYVPLPLSEVALDWMKVAEYQDEQGFVHQKMLLISVPTEQIQKYQRMFKAAGLVLQALEMESISLARMFSGDGTPTIVVDIGSRSTNIIFMEKGQLLWNAQSDFASASLTQALATSLSVNPLRAEELKKERGILGTGPNYELSTIMMPFLDAIINEVKKAQFTFAQQFAQAAKAERVVLSGGGANLLGIEKYFEREFGMPVVKAAPFVQFEYAAELAPLVAELNPVMTVALGLGIKSFL